MARLCRMMVLSCFIVVITGGCASLVVADKTRETIKPSGIHEDCMELLSGQILEYSFEASTPLNFNVHYHDDHDVVYGITKDGVSGDNGTFRCEKNNIIASCGPTRVLNRSPRLSYSIKKK